MRGDESKKNFVFLFFIQCLRVQFFHIILVIKRDNLLHFYYGKLQPILIFEMNLAIGNIMRL
jgi:hypothetical protein